MKRNWYILFFALALAANDLTAQVTTKPIFIAKGYKGEIVVTYNPKEGNKGMVNATACYAHTGLITEKSTSSSDWKYVGTTWRENNPKYKMTKVADGWQLTIPNIYTFYGCPETEEIERIAFVFNDGPNGSLEGKDSQGKDIYVDLVETGLVAKIVSPSEDDIIVTAGESVIFECVSSEEADLSLKVGDTEQTSTKGTELSFEVAFETEGEYTVSFTATTAEESKTATRSVTVMGKTIEKARPEGKKEMGIYYDPDDDTKVTLCTYAASKTAPARAVYVTGDFNDWRLADAIPMYRDGNFFWAELDNLEPQKEYAYQYCVVRSDGKVVKISDAYSTKVLHPDDAYEPRKVDPTLKPYPKGGDGGYVSVLQTAKPKFEWSEETLHFKRPDKNNLIIYEMWVYDYTITRNIEGVRQRLDYLENLGVNAIELMPICEFEGNYNWGYSPTHYFAPDKAYGTETQIKRFIDECHKRGIAVIMDMVFNHATGLNPQNKLYPYGADLAQNPWFNVTAPHGDNVFEDWNHDFEETRKMFTRCLRYWIEEFHVDGYRMDLSHGFCGPTCTNRIANIKHYYTEGVQAASEGAYFILEHWGDKMQSERPELVKNGMLCWQNTNDAYSKSAMGNYGSANFSAANQDGYVSYCESHDEERNFYMAKKNGVEAVKTDETARLSRVPLNMAFNLLLNGPHMIWQWNELGFDYSINSVKGSNSINSNNRCSIKEQPEALGWLRGGIRMEQYKKAAQLIQLRTKLAPDIFEGNPTSVNLGTGAVRSITWGSGENTIFIAGNFSATDVNVMRLPDGRWYDYFSGTVQRVGTINLMPGELRIFTSEAYPLPDVPTYYDFSTAITDIPADNGRINAYPTLTDGIVNFSEEADVRVYNIAGQTVMSATSVSNIDLTTANRGMYLLVLQKGREHSTIKIIKQ